LARNGLARNAPYVGPLGYLHYNGKLHHRSVWESHMGPIPDGYIVHHINGDKTDNRISNLELMSRSEHCRHHSPRTGYKVAAKLICGQCGQLRGEREIISEPTRSKCNRCRGQDNRARLEARHANI
jgi:hypothetical protein